MVEVSWRLISFPCYVCFFIYFFPSILLTGLNILGFRTKQEMSTGKNHLWLKQVDKCSTQWWAKVPALTEVAEEALSETHWGLIRGKDWSHLNSLISPAENSSAGMLMFQVERNCDSASHAVLHLESAPPVGMQSPWSVSERLSIGTPMASSHGKSSICVCSGEWGGKEVLFSKTIHKHQDCLTVGAELQTFLAEPSTATVSLLKETSHQWKDLGLKACGLGSFVPWVVPWCGTLSLPLGAGVPKGQTTVNAVVPLGLDAQCGCHTPSWCWECLQGIQRYGLSSSLPAVDTSTSSDRGGRKVTQTEIPWLWIVLMCWLSQMMVVVVMQRLCGQI